MSNDINKHIEGDLGVGGDIYGGGNLNVGRNAVIRHDLIVQGYLDAPNIKTQCQGVFVGEDALFKARPEPKAGWWAIVIDTGGDDTVSDVYMYCVVDESWAMGPSLADSGFVFQISLLPYLDDIASRFNAVTEETTALKETHIADIKVLSDRLDALVGDNASGAIDSFNEVLKFLDGIQDSETLAAKLNELRTRIDGCITAAELASALSVKADKTDVEEALGRKADVSAVDAAFSRLGILPFDRVVYAASELFGAPSGTVAFSVQEHMFIVGGSGGVSPMSSYNTTTAEGLPCPRTDRLYSCCGALYVADPGSRNLIKTATLADTDAIANSRPATVILTEAEYEALAPEEINPGTLYMTTEE